jgi:coatomer subunit beta'
MRLDVKRQLFARSERVKGIDFHPTEPWILTTLYSGHVNIWSYISQSIVKTFELTDVPVRAGRFVARKNWIVAGAPRPFHIHKAHVLTWCHCRLR